MIKLASIARRHQLSSVCLTVLNKLQNMPLFSMRPQQDNGSKLAQPEDLSHFAVSAVDKFNAVREQVKTCISLQSQNEVKIALAVISSRNLGSFIPPVQLTYFHAFVHLQTSSVIRSRRLRFSGSRAKRCSISAMVTRATPPSLPASPSATLMAKV